MLTQYLIKQAKKPSGAIGRIMTKIWSSYFKDISLWTIKQTRISVNSRILEVGYGGGSTIKNLIALNKNLEIHGIDISKESYQTTKREIEHLAQSGSVQLMIGSAENLPYQNQYFDLVFAIQAHLFWKDLRKGLQEIYRVMAKDSILVIASEKDKINYHMTTYRTTSALSNLLKSIGFSKIETREQENWISYTIHKPQEN